jgi:hypothetical protein
VGVIVLFVLALIVMAILAGRKSRTLGAEAEVLEWVFFGRKEFQLP